jgi:hypothetical protein
MEAFTISYAGVSYPFEIQKIWVSENDFEKFKDKDIFETERVALQAAIKETDEAISRIQDIRDKLFHKLLELPKSPEEINKNLKWLDSWRN